MTAIAPHREQLKVTVDAETKRKAADILGEYGISMTTAISMYLRQIVVDGGLPFRAADPFYSAENQRVLSRSIAQLEAGEGIEHELRNSSDA